ncbi:hypothetical protein BC628DRAFT_1382903 [Trametes gibbosa]|nr:hypothetical protein BC628DRAFT_1382903 [Trametes gibbosa]
MLMQEDIIANQHSLDLCRAVVARRGHGPRQRIFRQQSLDLPPNILRRRLPSPHSDVCSSLPYAMPPSLDKLPIHLWEDIFRYACTDGGRTGAALASTSSCIRATSAAYRFYSLKFTNLAQIGRFLLCLDRIERAQAPHAGVLDQRSVNTRHLLLSFFPDDCDSLVRSWRGWREYSSRKSKRQQQLAEDELAWYAVKGAWDRQFIYLVPRLLRLVAPTLETLAILQHPEISLPHIKVELFALRELSLLSDDAVFVRPSAEWEAHANRRHRFDDLKTCAPAPFPSLTHLHIVYEGGKQYSWERTLPLWTELAPALTHLRVSQASNLHPEALEGMPTRSFPHMHAAHGYRAALSYPRLRRIILQPLVLRPVTGHEMRHEASLLAKASRGRGGAKVVILRGRWHREGYWRDRLRWEWEDRMLGKAGCWGEREEDEGEWTHERRKRIEVAAQKLSKLQIAKASAAQIKDWIRLDSPDRMFPLFGGSLLRGTKSIHGRAASL